MGLSAILKKSSAIDHEPESDLDCLRSRLESELEELVQLRPMPAVAMRLMELCREPQPKIADIVETIQCDPAIVMRVLAVANSPLYGYSREIISIQQAVVVLGFRSLSQLTVTIAAGDVFSKGEVAVLPRRELFEHSLAAATISRLLSPTEPTVDPGAAFLAGMLHDVGKLVLLDLAPDGYTQLRIDGPHRCSAEAEAATFGMSHTEIGLAYGEAWGLPFEINEAISEHHLDPDQDISLASIASLASGLTKHWGLSGNLAVQDQKHIEGWIERVGETAAERMQQVAEEQYSAIKELCT